MRKNDFESSSVGHTVSAFDWLPLPNSLLPLTPAFTDITVIIGFLHESDGTHIRTIGHGQRKTGQEVSDMTRLIFPKPFVHRHPSMEIPQEAYEKSHTIGQRAAEGVARAVGSWAYIIVQTALVVLWSALNVIAWSSHWDPYPFIFLNLVFSIAGAYTAPLIMMSQNRQDEIDRIDAHNDYMVNQKMEQEIHVVMDHLDAQNRALQLIYERLEGGRSTESGEPGEPE